VATGPRAALVSLETSLAQMGLTRTVQTWKTINHNHGFDCPSCAWADPQGERSRFEFCESGAKAVADDATLRRVGADFFSRHSVEELSRRPDHWLNAQGRLTEPMVLRPGHVHYEPIAWDAAFALVAAELNDLASPNEAIFYTSGKITNEPAFLFQLFARQFGTNNLPDCSNMCHESSGLGLNHALGEGKSTVTLEDLEGADCIVIAGQNPGTNHPRMLTALQNAKRRGATIIAVNPMREVGLLRFKHPQEPLHWLGSGTQIADHYLQIRINGDVALFKGLSKAMLDAEAAAPGTVLDRQFIADYTNGFEAFTESIRATCWADIVEQSGIDEATIREIGGRLARSRGTVICWAMGLTQHRNAVDNVREVINLLLLRGDIGRPYSGAMCVRGHSNVQGDRTMGIWEQPREAFLEALDRELGIRAPRDHGYDSTECLHAMHDGRVKVFFGISGNLLSAAPDTHYAAEAFSRCNLVTYVSTKLNRNHLVTGKQALILPCIGRAEREIQGGQLQLSSAEDSMGIVNPTRGSFDPISEHLLSDVEILVRLAAVTFGDESPVDWKAMLQHDRVREHIERVIPGFDDFNVRLRKGPFYLPNGARERQFHTSDGKAHFSVCGLPDHALGPKELLMTTVRSHDQFNTTIYGLDDRYRGIFGGRRVILLNEADMKELGVTAGEWVDITSHFEGERRVAPRFKVVPYPIARKSAATYYPEANVLVPVRSVANRSNQPAHKCVRITLSPSERRALPE
jgi:molybdopterin-dependent oxidoreductase alpha subunit